MLFPAHERACGSPGHGYRCRVFTRGRTSGDALTHTARLDAQGTGHRVTINDMSKGKCHLHFDEVELVP